MPTSLSAWNRPDTRSLLINLAACLGAVFVINGLIFGLGWNNEPIAARPMPSFAPPDWSIGAVWTVLFALFAWARWETSRTKNADFKSVTRARNWIAALVVSCLLYPVYALATGSVLAGLAGNAETILLTFFVIANVAPVSRRAAFLLAPVVVWVSFATFLTLRQAGYL